MARTARFEFAKNVSGSAFPPVLPPDTPYSAAPLARGPRLARLIRSREGPMRRAVVVFALCSLFALPRLAAAGERMLHGRVVDGDGNGVAAVEVASAWTATASGLKSLRGVQTDTEGRFALACPCPGAMAAIVAYDASRAHGAFVVIDPAAFSKEQSLSLVPTVRVSGELSADDGKHYPADCVCFVAPAAQPSYAIQIEPEKGKYSVPLPPGTYVMNVQAPGRGTRSIDVVVAGGKSELALARLDLKDHTGRVQLGDLGPPIRLKVGHPALDAALSARHAPDRWTLLYFWDFT